MGKLTTIAVVLLTLPACVHTPDRVTLLAASHHVAQKPLNNGSSFNEINPGMFMRLPTDTIVDLNVGAYLNSYGKPSVAGFVSVPIIEGLDLFGGLAWYPLDGRTFGVSLGDVVPIAGVQATLGNVVVQVTPSDCQFTCAVVSMGLTFDIGEAAQ